jgi:hypothetical protein
VFLDALASVFQLFDANGNQEQEFYDLFEDVCVSQLLNSWVFHVSPHQQKHDERHQRYPTPNISAVHQ